MSDEPKLPPHDRDAERGLLGSILRDNAVFSEVSSLLDVESFYGFANQQIFRGFGELLRSGKPADPVTIAHWLHESRMIEDVGGERTIIELWNEAPSAPNAAYYAEIIQSKFVARRAIIIADRLTKAAFDGSEIKSAMEDAGKAIFGLSTGKTTGHSVSLQQVVQESVEIIHARTKVDRETPGVPTGFTDLDRLTCGWQPGELSVIAARPSAGKTTFAGNVFMHAAVNAGFPCLFFTLEQRRQELGERFLVGRSGVDAHHVRNGTIKPMEMDRIIAASGEIASKGCRSFVSDICGQTVDSIKAEVMRIRMGCELRLIVIDYLQLITSTRGSRQENREQQVAGMSRALKLLAVEMSVPIVVLAQLNRGSERDGRKPRMSDLRESGAIEQDADVVMLLWNEQAEMEGEDAIKRPKNGPINVIIDKNRNGRVGEVTLYFQRELLSFRNMARGDGPS
jgi:replicative DNA helicase